MKKSLLCLLIVLAMVFPSAVIAEVQESSDQTAALEQYRTVGAHVFWGSYPQSENGEDQTPIEWLVLEVDEDNHKALLLTYYGLDMQRYHRSQDSVTWETCSLRAWLNEDFLSKAFTPEEQAAILLTDVDNSQKQCYGWTTAGGKDTQDRLFLLSYAEAHKYFHIQFGVKNNVAARISPTAYASAAGARQDNRNNKTEEGIVAGWWFLRSPGCYQYCVAAVGTDGSLYHTYVDTPHACIRPAFWLDLDAVSP